VVVQDLEVVEDIVAIITIIIMVVVEEVIFGEDLIIMDGMIGIHFTLTIMTMTIVIIIQIGEYVLKALGVLLILVVMTLIVYKNIA